MIKSIFQGNFDIIGFLMRIPCILIALSFHEFAHAYSAYKLGDTTARSFGRLTLNPIKHLDLFGTLCMLLFGFGWAKPVPINSRNFKNPRRDIPLTALAGPVMNFLLCFIGVLIFRISIAIYTAIGFNVSSFMLDFETISLNFWTIFLTLNVYLGVFNLLPVPPLDGSRIFLSFLPDKLYYGIMKYERYIVLVIMLLLYLGWLSKPLAYVSSLIIQAFDFLIGLIPFL
ncbi:MAG: site-2 protease family protein [Firmicutes bacterium]|nr:site-2 protease family protein [Bacillota bacterium]